ncbi:MAG: carboxymuconolactone decarboxylase family protein [Acidimicrobiales bacterium]|nr:carboxymuconolactone decarboxylase family protein [Acidimicrobiales bacterium]
MNESVVDGVDASETDAYEAARQHLIATRGQVALPFELLLRVPQLCTRVADLGEVIRFRGLLPDRLRETAILATAREVRCRYEFDSHLPIARSAGVAEATIALASGADADAPVDESLVVSFVHELLQRREVGEATLVGLGAVLSEPELVELCVTVGYYALLAGVVNVFAVDQAENMDQEGAGQ